jgi:tetratricopeptide (TPR) repeat protein
MTADFRQFDEQGFPLPPRFDDQKYHDDEPPRRSPISLKKKRLVMLVVLFGIVIPIAFGPHILAAGRASLSQWLRSRAEQKYLRGNYSGAIADASWAIGWSPRTKELYFLRAQCKEKVADLDGSLEDWNQSLGLTTSSVELSHIHSNRGWIYARLQRFQEAVDDASQAVKLSPTPSNLNTRAYIRALGKLQLDDALVDINKAIDEQANDNAEFLDTRGYVLHLLDRNDDALKDLDEAIKSTQQVKLSIRLQRQAFDPSFFKDQADEVDHSLAVMYHHRGLIYGKLGREDEASQDLRQADLLGYNPLKGIL